MSPSAQTQQSHSPRHTPQAQAPTQQPHTEPVSENAILCILALLTPSRFSTGTTGNRAGESETCKRQMRIQRLLRVKKIEGTLKRLTGAGGQIAAGSFAKRLTMRVMLVLVLHRWCVVSYISKLIYARRHSKTRQRGKVGEIRKRSV